MNDEYKSFSERHGYTQPKLVQRESVDQELLNGLWNVLIGTTYYRYNYALGIGERLWLLGTKWNRGFVWCDFMNNRKDASNFVWGYPDAHASGDARTDEFAKIIRDEYFEFSKDKWFRVFDFLDFLLNKGDFIVKSANPMWVCDRDHFIDQLNRVLKRENSAYHIVGGFFAEISSEQEIAEVERAADVPFQTTKQHIALALTSFANRENPDYKKTIGESILAVEAIAKEFTGDDGATLGKLTKKLNLHPALATALSNIHGFARDVAHHTKSGEPQEIDQATARYVLVTCSAFVNYVIARNQPK